ncbi:hypothetical protein [Enterococcus sp. DIV1314a]|uniref:hypothetical protein n=1 Tax=Enterococcus sp. DIV1314a TaxID=2774660 RepID=UPI003F68452B
MRKFLEVIEDGTCNPLYCYGAINYFNDFWSARRSLLVSVFDGYFKEALTSGIIAIERPNNEVTSLFYQVNQDPVEKATNGHLVTYKVEQKIWLNFASDYGEV